MADRILSLAGSEPHPMQTIAEELGSEGAGLVASLMENSRAHTDRIMDSLLEQKDAEIKELREELQAADNHIRKIERRFNNLLFAEESPLDDQVWA